MKTPEYSGTVIRPWDGQQIQRGSVPRRCKRGFSKGFRHALGPTKPQNERVNKVLSKGLKQPWRETLTAV
jgi:hypothetical protein